MRAGIPGAAIGQAPYRGGFGAAGFGLVLLGLAAAAGFLATTGSVTLVGGFAGALFGLGLVFLPNLLFAVAMLFALVFGGLLEFYLSIGQANWISSGLAAALGGAALLAAFRSNAMRKPVVRRMPGAGFWVLAYVLVLVLASLFNQISATQFAVGLRNYLPFVGVFLAMRFALTRATIDRAPAAIVWVGLLQLPFALHQFIFVGAQRAASLSAVGGEAEAVNGTFGGNLLGFGYSGSMAVFVLIATAIAFGIRSGRDGRFLSWAMAFAALACVGMAETKIVFVLTPIVLALVFWEKIKASPKKLFGLMAGTFAVLGVLGAIYAYRFWINGFDDFLQAFAYSFDPDFMVTEHYRGRVGTLVHWWNMNVAYGDALHTVLGYGVASTLEASRVLGVGSAVLQFGPGLDQHAASKLLWDAGALGLVFFVGIAVRSGFTAHLLVQAPDLSHVHRGMLKASRGAMVAFVAMLPYQVSVVGEAPMQALFWFFVGYISYWQQRFVRGEFAQ